MAKVVINIFTR